MPHTQGPWKVDTAEHRGIGGERIFKVIQDEKYGGLIAETSAWWVDTKSAEANAELIALAPKMFEVLKESILNMEWASKVLQVEERSTYMETLKDAMAIISQIEGKE